MTNDEFPNTFRGRVIEYGKIAGALSAMFMLVTLTWGLLGPIRQLYQEFLEVVELTSTLQDEVFKIQAWQSQHASAMTTLQENQAFILDTLDEATRPSLVFETNVPFSGARDGFCILGEECGIDVRTRRTQEGLRCVVIPGRERFYIVGLDTGERIQVFRNSGTPTTDIARDWFDYHWRVSMPTQMDEPAGFMYEFAYKNCRGERDEAEITQESAIIPIELVEPGEPAPAPLNEENGSEDLPGDSQ